MKTLVDHLAQYAAYHRDRRNIFSHFIGIPMIVLSIAVLLARPALGFGLSPALLLAPPRRCSTCAWTCASAWP